MAERARVLARGQTLTDGGRTQLHPLLLARLAGTRRILEHARARLSETADRDENVGPAGVWLLENFHVVLEHILEVRQSLPRGYYRQLPELSSGRLEGYPRVYELATTLISHTDGRVDLDNVDLFVGAFQEVQPLTIGELWAIPAMLRLALLESVRRMALRTIEGLDQTDDADRRANQMKTAGAAALPALDAVMQDFFDNPPRLTSAFVTRFLRRLRDARVKFPALLGLERWITETSLGVDEAGALSSQRLAITQVVMANSISSLRVVGRMDWKSFVERQSAIENVLRGDPAGFYTRMTFGTRDHYRHVVERIAKRTGMEETAVARRAIDLADRPDRGRRDSHVGYYLIDRGLAELRRATRYRRKKREWIHDMILKSPHGLFIGGILAGTTAALAALLWLGGPAAWSAPALVLLVGLLPALDLAIGSVNQLVSALLPPRLLPKLDLLGSGGIPAEFRTAVVIPNLFADVAAVEEALATLEVQFLANREAHLHFAVLSDFTDAATETCEGDDAIVRAAAEGVAALNARYAPDSNDAFYLFHRPRRWNAQQGVWMGWERKRGKLGEFNRFLRGGASDAFQVIVGDRERLGNVRYVITLDADTVLPPDAAPLLVGALAHPLNRAVYDDAHQRVVEGYGILQPRVGVSLPSAHNSHFAAVHSGHPGVDPYTTAVSDLYQDLFGEGSFTGKGIYDVDAFEESTHGRFPENRLLSHDLIEGSFARAGLATDIIVYDDYPTRYLTYTKRKHRWIRGDWQLLDWLTLRVPGPDGVERNRLSLLSRWKIFDNLRRSVLEIAQLAFLIAAWTVLPGSPARWTLLGLGAIAAPWILATALAVLRPPLDRSWLAYYSAVGKDARTSLKQLFLTIAFLPHQAWVSADAIMRTLWRVLVSKRRLLEWQAASTAERTSITSALGTWRTMLPALLGTVLLLGLVVPAAIFGAADPQARLDEVAQALLPVLFLWLMSPAIAHALTEPTLAPLQEIDAARMPRAKEYARLHWRYFDEFVSERTNGLAPDNYQETPSPALAMRTSPTNIGLQLLSTVSAYDLGFIELEDMTGRLETAFRSLERMDRFHGHFYNWYDLHDLRVLQPAYVSTVDSGNLAGHLIALRQACLGIQGAGELAPRLRSLADRAYAYALEMDFRMLYDEERELFAIGYQPETHKLDASYYDLLASESRLASFVAIAKNDVPVDHWFHLGRSLTRAAGATALVSWSGSMFEYLMPTLVMKSLPETVLDQTHRGAVRRQIAYGGKRGVPWGMSESAYGVRDRDATYQYRAFGVPDLGLKHGLDRDVVVAPYASLLALEVEPRRAMANLETLAGKGALGAYGFYDALDYTRAAPGERFKMVRAYMAHHVGMSLVALTNALSKRVWQERFHTDPLVRSAELLLHERVPRRLVMQKPIQASTATLPLDPDADQPIVREVRSVDTPEPHVGLLGHYPYTVMVTHCGGGFSRFRDLAVTRWRADATRDDTGQFCYVKDLAAGRVWSAAHQPVCAPSSSYEARLASDRVTFTRADGSIETRMEIAVVPQDAAEVRRVTVTNNGRQTREVELTSYGEVVIAPPAAERAHPAFANLFVETEFHSWCDAITATRRPRSAKERSPTCVHVVATGKERVGEVTCETDRARFVGRGRSVRAPVALDADGALSGTTGSVLDPVFALRTRVRLRPGQSASVAFTTLVAETREEAFALADRYHNPHAAQRAFDLAWTASQVELQGLDIAPLEAAVFQRFAAYLLYPSMTMEDASPPGHDACADERCLRSAEPGPQPLLWSMGVSGDLPIVLARIDSAEGLPTLRQLFTAHHYWRRRGVPVDVVVLDERAPTYLNEMSDAIHATLSATSDAGTLEQPGGVFVRGAAELAPQLLRMLRAVARVHVPCDGRSLGRILDAYQLLVDSRKAPTKPREAVAESVGVAGSTQRRPERPESRARRGSSRMRDLTERAGGRTESSSKLREARGAGDAAASFGTADALNAAEPFPPGPHSESPLRFANGIGGLNANDDYEILVRGDRLPPAPWANVIANPYGGFVVTERGGGFTWAGSSYFYRLTPWHNDPVCDPLGEVLYLTDQETGASWCPTPGLIDDGGSYAVRHGAGSSAFAHRFGGIASELTLGMAADEAVKIARLSLTNEGDYDRALTLTAYVEWTLGVTREQTGPHVHTAYHAELGAITARNSFEPEFAEWTSFCALSEPVSTHTASRQEFVGRNGTLAAPAGLERGLGGATGGGLDPCAALQCWIVLQPGETREVAVLLGAAPSRAEAEAAIARHRTPTAAKRALAESVAAWDDRLSVIRVRTPEPAFDAMINRWSLYQTLACRVWARSGFYQSSGAYGFRDQLQDVMALLYAEPALARAQILRAAARQFPEGDVQHWWHPHTGRGVRTRISDDLAWLPYVTAQYLRVTGDVSVLDETIPFLSMRSLTADEHEIYDLAIPSSEQASLYDHCLRALRKACTKGAHGLPLIGGGDWNDGMNRVGHEGRGESVWLAWFLADVLGQFADVVQARGGESREGGSVIGADDRATDVTGARSHPEASATAAELREKACGYVAAAEEHGWDGEWYRRAYFDDGSPLGSARSEECRIDAIAQSWSVISGGGSSERQRLAMHSLDDHLVREDARILQLLAPPFDRSAVDPGYIKGYLPGVRENGAQYTHAALWSVLAKAMQGDGDRAFQWMQMLNPLTHSTTLADVERYRVEPYVVAADVYTAKGQLGRGGWTWYTGSASWFYRVGLETLLGFTKRGDTLTIEPCIPAAWPGFAIDYRFGGSRYEIVLERATGEEVVRASDWTSEVAQREVSLDGVRLSGAIIPLVDDGAVHRVRVRV